MKRRSESSGPSWLFAADYQVAHPMVSELGHAGHFRQVGHAIGARFAIIPVLCLVRAANLYGVPRPTPRGIGEHSRLDAPGANFVDKFFLLPLLSHRAYLLQSIPDRPLPSRSAVSRKRSSGVHPPRSPKYGPLTSVTTSPPLQRKIPLNPQPDSKYYAGMEVAQGCTDPKGLKSRTECRFM